MNNHELEQLLADIESDRSERKASASDTKKIRQAICAFANDMPNHRQPGVIFVGANDDGSCAGISITDDLLLNLARDLVPWRPGRREPRAIKRRPKAFPLLNRPRHHFIEISHRSRYWKGRPRNYQGLN